jgi:hypothetical protein
MARHGTMDEATATDNAASRGVGRWRMVFMVGCPRVLLGVR